MFGFVVLCLGVVKLGFTEKNRGKMPERKEISIRSSAAEYLTFIAATGESGVDAVYADENVWLTQKMMGLLYGVETHTINYHLQKVFSDNELDPVAVIRNFRITAPDGKTYDTKHYNLKAIIAVGYKVNSERAVQFRKWATDIIESYTIKAFVMDDEDRSSDGRPRVRVSTLRLASGFYPCSSQSMTLICSMPLCEPVPTSSRVKRYFG